MRYTYIFLLTVLLFNYHSYSDDEHIFDLKNIELCEKEKQFIKEHPVINIYTDNTFAPIEIVDENDNMSGISGEYLKLITKITGLKFKIHVLEWASIIKKLKNRKVDMILAMSINNERKEYTTFSDIYLEFPSMIFSANHIEANFTLDQIQHHKLALVDQYATMEYIEKKYPYIDLQKVTTVTTGLKMTSSGISDFYAGNIATASYYMTKNGITNLYLVGDTEYVSKLAFGIRKDWKILADIINKCLKNISEQQKEHIYKHWIDFDPSHHLDHIQKKIYDILKYIIPIMTIVILFIILINIRLKKIIEHRTKKLNDSLKYIDCILNSLSSQLISIDKNKNIVRLNNTAELFLSQKKKDLINQNICDFFPEIPELETKIENTLQSNDINSIRQITIKEKIYDILFYPLNLKEYQGVVLKIDDITEKTLMLENILQSEKMSELGNMAAGIVHEINNPLSGIFNALQNIKRRLFKKNKKNLKVASEISIDMDKIIKYLEINEVNNFIIGMEKSLNKATAIIKNILFFSSKKNIKLTKVDLNKVILSTLDLLTNLYNIEQNIDFKKIKIDMDLQERLPGIPANAIELEQVIINILKNAIYEMLKFQSTDKMLIKIKTYTENNFVVAHFYNNGPTIPDNIINNIFEPFFSTKEVNKGTGIGLSLSNFIITEHHKGIFSVKNIKDQGVEFEIKIPIDFKE